MAGLPRNQSGTNSEEEQELGHTDDSDGGAEQLLRERLRSIQLAASAAPKARPTSSKARSASKSKSKASPQDLDEEIEESLRQLKNQGKYVKLNVGGSLHYTTIGTLTKHDNMLRAMFSQRIPLAVDDEGWVLIDRSGKYFATILDFLRDGSVSLPETRKECLELLAEAKYYCIVDLVEAVETQLVKLKDEHHPICRVPVITSLEEEHLIVSSSSKPVIKLLYNRGNNKYSYTTNSDDNLLKNIELFDKLSVKFSSRVKFMKDIVGRGEICCWAFYGNARKIAEVCCESIVYTTDRKHTKIEFPEAKILEETLNIMLYEKRTDDPAVALRDDQLARAPGTPDGVLSEDELR